MQMFHSNADTFPSGWRPLNMHRGESLAEELLTSREIDNDCGQSNDKNSIKILYAFRAPNRCQLNDEPSANTRSVFVVAVLLFSFWP